MSKNNKTGAILGVCAGALALCAALAGITQARTPRERMARMALAPDKDGVITRAEARSRAEDMFARMDANHDGKLDDADREIRRKDMEDAAFKRMDSNNDGAISRAEFAQAGARREGGHAGPGAAPPPEGPPAESPPPGPGPAGPGMRGAGMADSGMPGPGMAGPGMPGPGRGMGGPGGMMGMMGMMRMADANKDGSISKAEFVAAAMARFDKSDTNKDGTIGKEERGAAFRAMRKDRQFTPPPTQ